MFRLAIRPRRVTVAICCPSYRSWANTAGRQAFDNIDSVLELCLFQRNLLGACSARIVVSRFSTAASCNTHADDVSKNRQPTHDRTSMPTKPKFTRPYDSQRGPSRTLLRMRERMRAHHNLMLDSSDSLECGGDIVPTKLQKTKENSAVTNTESNIVNESAPAVDCKVNIEELFEKYDFLHGKREEIEKVIGMPFGTVRLDSVNKPTVDKKQKQSATKPEVNNGEQQPVDGSGFIDEQYFSYQTDTSHTSKPTMFNKIQTSRESLGSKDKIRNETSSKSHKKTSYAKTGADKSYIDEQYFGQLEESCKKSDEIVKDDPEKSKHRLSFSRDSKEHAETASSGSLYIDDQYFHYNNDNNGAEKSIISEAVVMHRVESSNSVSNDLSVDFTRQEAEQSSSENITIERQNVMSTPEIMAETFGERKVGDQEQQLFEEISARGVDDGPVTKQMLREGMRQQKSGKAFEVAMSIRSEMKEKTADTTTSESKYKLYKLLG